MKRDRVIVERDLYYIEKKQKKHLHHPYDAETVSIFALLFLKKINCTLKKNTKP